MYPTLPLLIGQILWILQSTISFSPFRVRFIHFLCHSLSPDSWDFSWRHKERASCTAWLSLYPHTPAPHADALPILHTAAYWVVSFPLYASQNTIRISFNTSPSEIRTCPQLQRVLSHVFCRCTMRVMCLLPEMCSSLPHLSLLSSFMKN